ncbi:diacylglycerol kinase family protein [Sphingomonas bacterium]|uniref:diacylglycerol/lipid kinase family protein n=1 Tax=Sphingomonas bacterium TaxID=1895847 RepID=UPI00157500E8|nr:diacylglycerol kinase family protein [Sphingomonas bacterium]
MAAETASGPIPVVVNRHGGTAGKLGDRLRPWLEEAFAAAGLTAAIHLVDGEDIPAAVRKHRDARLIVVGGGDGTLGCAANELAGRDTALGILPLGTHNHLAGALGIPTALSDAVKLFADPAIRAIDIVRVNGRAFVNNASIGFYPVMVEGRDARRELHSVPKWVAAIPAGIDALRRLRHHRLRLSHDAGDHAVATPMLFVGNNRYSLEAGQLGKRNALDKGMMSVFAVASHRRLALIGFALRTLVGRADMAADFAELTETATLTVEGRSRHVRIALDGEVTRLRMPLRFETLAGGLRVVAPLSVASA